MEFAILTDFGSTYTKMSCVELDCGHVIATHKCPSTVQEDALIGLEECFATARKTLGENRFRNALKLSTSSAAGGLRIAVVGLTEAVSTIAGRNASFSAGAKIVFSGFGRLNEKDIEKIEQVSAEIFLLCGGYENGNTRDLLHNAEFLSKSRLTIPTVYAGNSAIANEVRELYKRANKECFIVENIIPAIGTLNTDPTAKIIRHLFMQRITNMKGIGEVRHKMDGPILPTPAAVLKAGELLSTGTANTEGIGSFMLADIGGATTDIYSFTENFSYSGAKVIGIPEPYAKRTVEGDMGMRESSGCLLHEVGRKKFAGLCGLSEAEADQAVEKRMGQKSWLADTEKEKETDRQIACSAVSISARRHAGNVRKEFNDGCRLIQRGKNLTEIKFVIGTGGVLANNDDAYDACILENVRRKESESDRILLPETVKTAVDRDYIFYAAGLLREYDEEAAIAIMKNSIGGL